MNKNFSPYFVDSSQYWKFLKIFENPVLVSYKKVSYKKKACKMWEDDAMNPVNKSDKNFDLLMQFERQKLWSTKCSSKDENFDLLMQFERQKLRSTNAVHKTKT